MPVLMLQHGDFFDDPSVAAASVLREGLTVDEVFRVFFFLYHRLRFLTTWFCKICPDSCWRDRPLGTRS